MKKTPENILYEAILKAEKNGYKEHLNYLPLIGGNIKHFDEFLKKLFFMHKQSIIFSHSFAKAFFGEEDWCYTANAWVHRLEEMSKEEDEVKYLEKFL